MNRRVFVKQHVWSNRTKNVYDQLRKLAGNGVPVFDSREDDRQSSDTLILCEESQLSASGFFSDVVDKGEISSIFYSEYIRVNTRHASNPSSEIVGGRHRP